MDEFNYLSVFVSIILGLGVTRLLAGVGRWIEQRSTIRSHAAAVMWAGIVLVVHIQTWWSMFGLRFVKEWTFPRFAIVLLQPIVLYLLAFLIVPSQGAHTSDLRGNYFNQRRWFFGLFLALLAVSVCKDVVISGSLPGSLNLAFHGLFAIVAIASLITERERLHQLTSILAAIALAVYIGLLFWRLG